jgi:hypothetical protein
VPAIEHPTVMVDARRTRMAAHVMTSVGSVVKAHQELPQLDACQECCHRGQHSYGLLPQVQPRERCSDAIAAWRCARKL